MAQVHLRRASPSAEEPPMPRHGSRRVIAAAIAAAALIASGPALAEPPPSPQPPTAGFGLPTQATPGQVVDASPLETARRQEAALQLRLDALQSRTEQAAERFDQVQASYQQAAEQQRVAQLALTAAIATAQARDAVATDRIRALYMDGGAGGLLGVVINGASVTDVLNRYYSAQSVVADDTAQLAQATVAAQAARTAEQRLAAATRRQNELRRQAGLAAAAVRAQLTAARRLLESASATVRALLAAQLKAERDAAARLAALLRRDQVRNAGKAVTFGTLSGTLPRQIAAMLLDAEAQLDKPYQWGATGPQSYDCSGLVQHAFAAAGVSLPRTAAEQYRTGSHPDTPDLRPGDLLFWATDVLDPRTIDHEAIYLGGGYMIVAPHTGAFVSVQRVYIEGYLGATRVGTPSPVPTAMLPPPL